MNRKFYKKQNDLIKDYEDLQTREVTASDAVVGAPTSANTRYKIQRKAEIAAKVSFGANVVGRFYQYSGLPRHSENREFGSLFIQTGNREFIKNN